MISCDAIQCNTWSIEIFLAPPVSAPQLTCETNFKTHGCVENLWRALRQRVVQVCPGPARPGWPEGRPARHSIQTKKDSSESIENTISTVRGSIAYFHFKMPFECSNLSGARPIFPARPASPRVASRDHRHLRLGTTFRANRH